MVDIYETAYPRFKSSLTAEEVKSTYTPTDKEMILAWRFSTLMPVRIYYLLILKTVQRLGYMPKLEDIPDSIIEHIKNSVKEPRMSLKSLNLVENSSNRQKIVNSIRNYLKIIPVSENTNIAIELAARQAATVKQELPDIINIVIEELIRQNYELPGFTTISRTAQTIRSMVNEEYFNNIADLLSDEIVTELNNLLILDKSKNSSGWNQLKQESKKPTNKEVKRYIEHILWLKNWIKNIPDISHIPVSKHLQFTLEARALTITQMKELKPNKRYALTVILIHSQLNRTLDDIVEILIKKLRKLHYSAEEALKLYFIEHQKRAEKLITQFRDVLEAFQEGQNNEERGKLVKNVIHSDPMLLLAECEEHIAYAGNNYIPFLIRPYQPQRQLLLNCISLLELKTTSSDTSLINAIQFVLESRHSHKKYLDYPLQHGSLKWIPEKWRKFIFEQSAKPSRTIDRKYFELCVLTEIMQELWSGDLYVSNSDQYSDYRDQLIDWEEYEQQALAYGQMLDLPIVGQDFINHWLCCTKLFLRASSAI